jgi:katanin p60 ATPase-containing subunit A1
LSIKIEDSLDLDTLATRLEGYSGADITNVCRDASMMSMRRRIKGLTPDQIKALSKEELEVPLSNADFEASIKKILSSVSSADIKKYDDWMAEYGSA